MTEGLPMPAGKLLAILIAPKSGAPMEPVDTVDAIAGQGLAGDRYGSGYAKWIKGEVRPEQHITLIESEALAALNEDREEKILHRVTRRNLLTAGVDLLSFIGQRFRIGDVELQGIEPCAPCGYLENLTQIEGIKDALKPCGGGLRAAIITSGAIQAGDVIELAGTGASVE